jgi:hypothetical protein
MIFALPGHAEWSSISHIQALVLSAVLRLIFFIVFFVVDDILVTLIIFI